MNPQRRKRMEAQRQRWLGEMRSIGEFVRGSVVTLRRRCSYAGCRRCKAGLKHPALYHTVSKRGKTQTTYLGASRAGRCREQAQAYQRLMELVEKLSDVNLALLTGKERLP
jgi:hypothetical protein